MLTISDNAIVRIFFQFYSSKAMIPLLTDTIPVLTDKTATLTGSASI